MCKNYGYIEIVRAHPPYYFTVIADAVVTSSSFALFVCDYCTIDFDLLLWWFSINFCFPQKNILQLKEGCPRRNSWKKLFPNSSLLCWCWVGRLTCQFSVERCRFNLFIYEIEQTIRWFGWFEILNTPLIVIDLKIKWY